MIHDAVKDRAGIAICDLEKELKDGPVATLWLNSTVLHGLHDCLALNNAGSLSVLCEEVVCVH